MLKQQQHLYAWFIWGQITPEINLSGWSLQDKERQSVPERLDKTSFTFYAAKTLHNVLVCNKNK